MAGSGLYQTGKHWPPVNTYGTGATPRLERPASRINPFSIRSIKAVFHALRYRGVCVCILFQKWKRSTAGKIETDEFDVFSGIFVQLFCTLCNIPQGEALFTSIMVQYQHCIIKGQEEYGKIPYG